jgi:hypothetical protein
MRIACPCAVAFALLVCAAPARAQFTVPPPVAPGEDYHVEIGAVFWSPDPALVIGGDGLSALGDEVDFVGEFGIPRKRFTGFRGTLKLARKHKLRFEYIPFKYEEETTIQRRIVFGGQVFDIGIPAAADVEWRLWRAGYEWDFVSAQSGFLGLIAELKHSTVTAQIDSPFATAIVDSTAPIPAIGIIGRGYFTEDFSVTGEFTGFRMLDALSEEFDAEYWEWDVYATANFGRNLGVQGGYRSIDAEYLGESDLGRLEMKGWYFGGVLRF